MQTIDLVTKNGNRSSIMITSDRSVCSDFISDLQKQNRKVVAIIDSHLAKLYGNYFNCAQISIEADEKCKTFDTIIQIQTQLLQMNVGKELFLIGIGGGIITDICGFVASIYKRGVDFAFIPTTFLAMIDAAIGGKNGVNVLTYKNMAGTIRQPQRVIIYTPFLNTLSDRLFRCGLAEMLKMFIITGQHYEDAVSFFSGNNITDLLPDPAATDRLHFFIKHAIEIKCSFVKDDEFDVGNRRLLNLGHTFAHAIEHCDSTILHGEAVAMGIICSAKLAKSSIYERLCIDFKNCNLPISFPKNISKNCLKSAFLNDKKNESNQLTVILLHNLNNLSVISMEVEDVLEIL